MVVSIKGRYCWKVLYSTYLVESSRYYLCFIGLWHVSNHPSYSPWSSMITDAYLNGCLLNVFS